MFRRDIDWQIYRALTRYFENTATYLSKDSTMEGTAVPRSLVGAIGTFTGLGLILVSTESTQLRNQTHIHEGSSICYRSGTYQLRMYTSLPLNSSRQSTAWHSIHSPNFLALNSTQSHHYPASDLCFAAASLLTTNCSTTNMAQSFAFRRQNCRSIPSKHGTISMAIVQAMLTFTKILFM